MQVVACIYGIAGHDGTQANFRRLTRSIGPIAADRADSADHHRPPQ
jgi:hypothetical protein